jgi:hypothetical protein
MVNRETLKRYFAAGTLPTEANFSDLVDSTLNMRDDGFSRKPEHGVEIRLVGDATTLRRLISFFSDAQRDAPEWAITCSSKTASLNFVYPDEKDSLRDSALLTLTRQGKVGIGIAAPNPVYRLDVDGPIRSDGRTGRMGSVLANGDWHPISDILDPDWKPSNGEGKGKPLTGCHALEIMAGVGLSGKRKGRYALLHAMALNTFNPTGVFFQNFLNFRKRIRCTHAWYLSRADRLKLRWRKDKQPHTYRLELKTVSSYCSPGEDIHIHYSIAELWFDERMHNSLHPHGGGDTTNQIGEAGN